MRRYAHERGATQTPVRIPVYCKSDGVIWRRDMQKYARAIRYLLPFRVFFSRRASESRSFSMLCKQF